MRCTLTAVFNLFFRHCFKQEEKMQKFILALLITVLSAGSAAAHGSISKLPDSVQILQYKMKLYMNADDADTKNNLAMAYFRTNQLDKAKQELTAVLEKDANNFNALDGMGLVLLKEGNGAKALEYFNRALAINDKDTMLHVHLSVAHTLLKQPDPARSELEQAEALASGPEELTRIQDEIKLLSNS
jgi:tetratricopeptide (TPR) repeat protein